MAKISMKALLESGVHFGHRTHRWNPHMKPYIFTERNGIHIIDLQQTVKALETAFDMVRDIVAEGGTVLFVGTKRQAHETIQMEAERAGMPYVTVRWLGGMLTNWITMRQRVLELERLERMRDHGEFERLTKKEALGLNRQINKLEARFGGIRKLHKLPDILFVVDVRREETSVKEANSLNIPVLALVDTNCDPRDIDYVIPSNDDAIRTIKLMVGYISDAVLEGRAMRKEDDLEELPAARIDAEEELTDEELLGEATLAKVEAAQVEAEAKATAKAEAEAKAAQEELSSSEEEKPQPKEKAKVEADVETEEKVKPKEKTAEKAAPKAEEVKAEVEEKAVVKEKAKEEAESKAEEKARPKTKAKTKSAPKAEEIKEKPKAKAKTKTAAKTKTKTETKSKTKTKTAAKTKTTSKTKSKTKSATKKPSEGAKE